MQILILSLLFGQLFLRLIVICFFVFEANVACKKVHDFWDNCKQFMLTSRSHKFDTPFSIKHKFLELVGVFKSFLFLALKISNAKLVSRISASWRFISRYCLTLIQRLFTYIHLWQYNYFGNMTEPTIVMETKLFKWNP